MPTVTTFGQYTICRPLLDNVPEQPEGAELTDCPYCGCKCWKMAKESGPMPIHGTFTAACTRCAFNRGIRQREMDAIRADREARGIPPGPYTLRPSTPA
jgi:hypothetical protein